ncbi:ArsA-related P-loop ATPase [Sorangium sp. So ce269]
MTNDLAVPYAAMDPPGAVAWQPSHRSAASGAIRSANRARSGEGAEEVSLHAARPTQAAQAIKPGFKHVEIVDSTERLACRAGADGSAAIGAIGLGRVRASAELTRAVPPLVTPSLPPLRSLIDEIAAPGRGLVMVMGKGGVGKTTIAASIAAELASRGHKVHLSTTDPAAHVAATLDGQLDNLEVSRIDPVAETKVYVERVMASRGANLDEAGRALLAEDLRSPCYEEVAVFTAFSRTVSQGRSSFVVLDTAPTGHTLLLLDATGSYHRQTMAVDADAKHASARLVTPLMRLRDPQYTKILLVTLAETTPVSEAARLQADLRRAQIEPFAWVINSSLAAAGVTDPCLKQRVAAELDQIEAVRERHARRIAIIPWMTEQPVGPDRLLALARGARGGGAEEHPSAAST